MPLLRNINRSERLNTNANARLKVTGTLLSDPKLLKPSKQADGEGMALPPKKTLEALNEKATAKLGEIVRRYSTGDVHWQGYDAAEIEATRQLLAKDEAQVVR